MSKLAVAFLTPWIKTVATDQVSLTTGHQSVSLRFAPATFIGKTVSGFGALVSGLLLNLVELRNAARPGAADFSTADDLAVILTNNDFPFVGFINMSLDRAPKREQERAGEMLAGKPASLL